MKKKQKLNFIEKIKTIHVSTGSGPKPKCPWCKGPHKLEFLGAVRLSVGTPKPAEPEQSFSV